MRSAANLRRWRRCVAGVLLALIAVGMRSVSGQPAPLELVYTAPQDCDLDQPDLRSPRQVWPELFDAARERIDIEQYYLTDGEALRPILASLRRATERGVRLRVLVDASLQPGSQPVIDVLRGYRNTEVRVLPFAKLAGGIVHNKLLLVDGRLAYVGSQNFDWRALQHIHELGLRIAEPRLVAQLQALFDWDWAAQETLARSGQVVPLNRDRPLPQRDQQAYLVGSPPAFLPSGIGDAETELVRLISTAQRRLQVQLLLYAPLSHDERSFYAPIDNALRAAAARGVTIELLVSNWNTRARKIDWLKSLSLVPHMHVRIVSLPPARSGFIPYARVIHSKYMVLDDATLWLGTSNWLGGYFDRSRNVEIVVQDTALAQRAAAIHTQLWRSPYAEPIDVRKQYTPPRVF